MKKHLPCVLPISNGHTPVRSGQLPCVRSKNRFCNPSLHANQAALPRRGKGGGCGLFDNKTRRVYTPGMICFHTLIIRRYGMFSCFDCGTILASEEPLKVGNSLTWNAPVASESDCPHIFRRFIITDPEDTREICVKCSVLS